MKVDTKVKSAKIQTFWIQYGTLRMHNDESIACFLLKVDEIVNSMRNLGNEIKDSMVVEKILRSLTWKFDAKVPAIEQMQDLRNLTIEHLHVILTTNEMRKGGPSDIREATFKATYKGKEKEELKEMCYISYKEEANFIKKLQVGTDKFRGKHHFKCFSCGRVFYYNAKCPYKENNEKGKNYSKYNVRGRFDNKKSFYTYEDSECSSNNEDVESNQEYQLLMGFEEKRVDEFDVVFMDALERKILLLKK